MTLVTAKLDGLPEVFRALGQVDPQLRKAALANVRRVGQVIRTDARANVPTAPPMSGWQRRRGGTNRFGWAPGRVRSRIQVKTGTGSVRTGNIQLLRIVQRDGLGSLFDMGGRKGGGNSPQGRQMIRNLNRRGRASRTMWPAAEANRDTVEQALADAIKDMETTLNRLVG